MKKQIVTKDQIDGFRAKSRLFGQHGHGVNKSIDMITDATTKIVWYEISSVHGPIASVPYIDDAIEIYNNI